MRSLVYSNVLISLSGVGMALFTQLLAGFPISIYPLFIAFVMPMVVYNLNRLTDIEEDKVNVPDRTQFVEKYSKYLAIISICAYIVGLVYAFTEDLQLFTLSLIYPGLGVIYSVFRTKKYLYVKNLIVGVAWGTIPIVTGSYYGEIFNNVVLFLFAFFTSSWFINTIIFDIKDIEGDRAEGVRTVPNTYGLQSTKLINLTLNVIISILVILLAFSGLIPIEGLILLLLSGYITVYICISEEDHGYWFYGIVVDGEYIFLCLSTIVLSYFHSMPTTIL